MYEKLWGASASHISVTMPQTFSMGYLLESISLRQEIAVDILQNLCADVAMERTWSDKGLPTKNIFVVYLEAQGLKISLSGRKTEGGTGSGRVGRGGGEGSSCCIGRR